MLPGEKSDKLTTSVLKECMCVACKAELSAERQQFSDLDINGHFDYAPAHQINYLINWISVSVHAPLHQVIAASTFTGAVVCKHAAIRNWQLALALNE